MQPRAVVTAIVCVLMVGALGGPAVGMAVAGTESNASTEGGGVDGSTVDELIEEALEEHDVAGATAAVVEDDEIVHTEGYGYADYAAGEEVDPEETPFMVGSVAKLVVWSAVMDGVETGTLELEEPVGEYLDGHEFDGDDEVTLEHLGTHTPGYEDRLAGLFVEEHTDIDEWEAKLEREMPAQVRQPGETVAYSNHGTGLAGLVVQEAHDEPFEAHADERFFEPLGMEGATFEQPVPDDHEPVSKGHVPTRDGFETDDPAIVGVPPAGSMSATATDMGNFAIAKLQGGELEDERVLEEESVEELFEERATNHPGVNGLGYGYMIGERGGEEIVWHTGGTEYFQTLFVLFPEHDVGLFVSFNSPGGGPALVDVLDGFIEERFDGHIDEGFDGEGEATGGEGLEPDPETADRAADYEGEYRSTGFQTTHESLVGLVDAWEVSVTDEGYLELANPIFGDTSRWIEVEQGVFVPDPDDDAALFSTALAIEDETLYLDAPAAPYEQLSWHETATVQLGLSAAALLALLSTVLVWPVNAYRHRNRNGMGAYVTRTRLAVLGSVAVLVAFVVGIMVNTFANPNQLITGYSPWLRLTLSLLLVFAIVALVSIALVVREWGRVLRGRTLDEASTTRYGLAYLTALSLALLTLLWILWYWNLFSAATF